MKRKVFLGFLAGSAFSLSLSPFDFWMVSFVSPAVLYLLTRDGSVSAAISIFYSFTLGTFLFGVHWIFFQLMIMATLQFFVRWSGAFVRCFIFLDNFAG